ncbi:hypothetical protein PT279_01135 [Bifidobacterium sp. ESL0784]|uniref:DUF6541 family protein n=1 Tax=Bifidobacterium sp. ESL0784 TaxID=2983231 RepID=UPI0023F7CC51|nr:DUF6541 family protein [Bifidobacterium sp. ESL0784]MDF7640202.1 hypothetical protein [Bifidobacterium sp. ESL0784]
MNVKWKERMRRAALPVCSVFGVLAAFGIVLAWFPKTWDAWNLPLQEIDAPAHYYFIRKLLREGIGAATRLWPNDAYYPPMFHIVAAAIISAGQTLGIKVNIYAAFNIVWLVTSGLVWPAGVSLWASYFTRRFDGASPSWRPFSCAMLLIVPLLAVASASHPFQMLVSGPLIAFGLATTLLPYWLYVTLRLFDAIADRYHILRWLAVTVLVGLLCMFAHPRIAFTWLLLMAPFILLRLPWKLILAAFAAVVVCSVAFFFYMIGHYHSSRYLDPSSWFHTYVPNRSVPDALRIFFTDNISGFAGGFMAVVVTVCLAVAVAVIVGYLRSKLAVTKFVKRTGNENVRNVSEGATGPIDISAGDALAGASASRQAQVAGDGEKVVVDVKAYARHPASDGKYGLAQRHARISCFAMPTPMMAKDAMSLILAFALVCLVYVCSTSLTGWFPNIVAAAWYRAETRPLTMIPFAVIPLLVFAACVTAHLVDDIGEERIVAFEARIGSKTGRISANGTRKSRRHAKRPKRTIGSVFKDWLSHNGGRAVSVIVLAALAISCQFGNTTREVLGQSLVSNTTLAGKPEKEQLTRAKYDVLRQTVKITGDASVVISDPLNGSMYGSAMFDANMLYPIYNAMHEKNGAVFSDTEAAFASGSPAKLRATTCPIDGNVPKYFLSMGPQAPSLQMFTFRQQYDTFHRQDLIDGYVKAGVLVKVKDFSSKGSYAKGWALYRIMCAK